MLHELLWLLTLYQALTILNDIIYRSVQSLGNGLDGRGIVARLPAKAQDPSLLQSFRLALKPVQYRTQHVPQALWREVKRPGYYANRSRSFSAEMKNVWRNIYPRRSKRLQDVVLNWRNTLPFGLLQCYISLSSVVLVGKRTIFPGGVSFKSLLEDWVQRLRFVVFFSPRPQGQHASTITGRDCLEF
jgi:hypothetical protein